MNDSTVSHDLQFIDERGIEWSKVRRTRCQFYQRFHYAYPGPIQNLKQRLMVIPADRYGAQRLCSHSISVNPLADSTRQQIDSFGNRILELEVAQADESISFEVLMVVESENQSHPKLALSPASIRQLLKPTPLTKPNTEIKNITRQLQRETGNVYELAQDISDWVYQIMHYESAVTTVSTTAAEALALRRGLCQDYAHLMLVNLSSGRFARALCIRAFVRGRWITRLGRSAAA